MLTPTDIQAINDLSEGSKAIIWYALQSFNTDIKNIDAFCKQIDGGNAAMQLFHANVTAHSNALLHTVELMKFSESPVSLLEHFAPKP